MRSIGIALLLSLSTLAPIAFADTLYVSPQGNDTWSGVLPDPNAAGTDGPLATAEAARDVLRARKTGLVGTANVNVVFRAGTYFLPKTFELTAEDSGWRGGPITYMAHPGEEVRITGGIPVTGFVAVSDRDPARENVVRADLKALGVTEFPPLAPRGMGQAVVPSHVELFFNDRPMQLARWPNKGEWATIADAPNGATGGMFTYSGDRPAQWTQSPDVWLHGYWTWDWADSYVQIDRIDTAAKAIYTKEPHGVYGYTKDKRYYVINALEELDSPGEYYIDREQGILYFWPPSPIPESFATVSVTDHLISIKGASNIRIVGFTVEVCRGTAIQVLESEEVLIAGCTLRNIGNDAVSVSGGKNNTVRSCDIYETGEGAIGLTGGDRMTLTPGGHRAENNHIYEYSRWVRTYRPAIAMSGVGLTAANNRIHDAPHAGIIFWGNDHILEYNDVHDICKETGDVGAFYIGRDWSMRGHIIRHNYFHNIQGPYTHGAMAVYLDDVASGVTIYGNVFYKASRAAFIGGGRDNLIENNIFVECHPSVHIDARLTSWAKDYRQRGSGWQLEEKLEAMNWKEPPYSTRYPELVNILNDEPTLPKGNKIVRNISVGGKWLDLYDNLKEDIALFDSNMVDQDPHFVDMANGDFRLRDDSPAYQSGFKPIPYERIGLIQDEFHTRAPEKPFPVR
ncbi:MAG: hypothetical protein AMXMBFR84_49670 [Candidatus Hydrogenedentota bacterium]